ncbi:MCE family protein [Mycolicibacterium stellerae]|uniref:MCE family protein n=1 Tax=Mycolicibacterium stellerae TaxID=2358193 RepID=UPI000F0BC399|nr:MCE family protein [Mycolicibacterium stellerae]
MSQNAIRLLAGLSSIAALVAVITLAVTLFRGGLTPTVPITVVSPRAGLVMNPDAKVKMRGVEVGRVASIEPQPNGGAALHLAMDPAELPLIPANVGVRIAASTVFGAKFVELVAPAEPTSDVLRAGQVLSAANVTVENNTLFQQLGSVLSQIEPMKLNETLGAVSSALDGRGDKLGATTSQLDALMATLEPTFAQLQHGLEVAPTVFDTYADAAPDVLTIASNATRMSRTIREEQHNLDAFLVNTIGLADVGNDVVSSNRQPLTDVVHLLAPTTDLTNEYNRALNCALAGTLPLAKSPPPSLPGSMIMVGFVLGAERYRYPANLPKVAASGGPQCTDLPRVAPGKRTPYVVADVAANPWEYGNQGIVLNSDGLKQLLFGPIDGPPRNTAQIGQPG